MELAPDNCSSLTAVLVPHKRKLAVAASRRYFIGTRVIPRMDGASIVKYLGACYRHDGSLPPTAWPGEVDMVTS